MEIWDGNVLLRILYSLLRLHARLLYDNRQCLLTGVWDVCTLVQRAKKISS
jgi:hypothetical protein